MPSAAGQAVIKFLATSKTRIFTGATEDDVMQAAFDEARPKNVNLDEFTDAFKLYGYAPQSRRNHATGETYWQLGLPQKALSDF